MNKPRRDLTEGSIVRNIWHLALPMMIGNVLQNAFNIVDMVFVGRLGPSAIAAVGMSGVVLGFLFVVILGIYIGTVALVARLTCGSVWIRGVALLGARRILAAGRCERAVVAASRRAVESAGAVIVGASAAV